MHNHIYSILPDYTVRIGKKYDTNGFEYCERLSKNVLRRFRWAVCKCAEKVFIILSARRRGQTSGRFGQPKADI